jgi:dTMP kinase
MLILTARRDHLRRRILPALAEGTWVLCDRFGDSTLAYQGYGQGLSLRLIGQLTDLALGDLESAARCPDLTLLFDLDVATGLARAAARRAGEDRYESLGTAFHERVRHGFREIAAGDPARCLLIDAAQPPADVAAQVLAGCRERLGMALA